MIASAIAALLVIFISFFLWKIIQNKSEKDAKITEKRIPGMEPTNPKLGNIPDMKEAGSFHQFLKQLHKKYGDIASFYMGTTYAVSLGSAEYFKGSMKLVYRPGIFYTFMEPLIPTKSIAGANNDDWRRRRQTYDNSFSHENIQPLYSIFNKFANEIVALWSSFPAGCEIAINEDVVSLAIRILASASFGEFFRDPSKVQELQDNYHVCWGYFEKLIIGEINDGDTDEIFDNSKQALYDIIDDLIEYRKKYPSKNEYLLIDSILDSGLPDDVITADVLVSIVSGFHTTANLIIWAIYYLSHNEDVQQQAYEEIKTNLEDNEEMTGEKSINLKYLMQTIDETMRHYIPAPFAERSTLKDIMINGYSIPKQTAIVNALGVAMHDENAFPGPTKFDPDRFSDEKMKLRQPLAFEPFGMGKRKCPAYRFAYAEVLTVLAVLLRKFKFIGVEQPDMMPVYSLITRTSEDVLIKLEPRF